MENLHMTFFFLSFFFFKMVSLQIHTHLRVVRYNRV